MTMTRLARFLLGSLAVLLLGLPAFAAPDQTSPPGDPAALIPSDSYSYLEFDSDALDRGLRQLDLASLLEDPEFYDFFSPLFERLGADPAQPVDSLLARLPIRQYLTGRAALGVRGLHLRVQRPDGTLTQVSLDGSHPLNAQDVFDVLGLIASIQLDGQRLPAPEDYELGIDVVLVLDPGPALRALVNDALERTDLLSAAGGSLAYEEMDGQQIAHFQHGLERSGILGLLLSDAYGKLGEGRWILTTRRATMEEVLRMQPAKSLAHDSFFREARSRMSAVDPVVYAWSNKALELSAIQALFPPLLTQALDLTGLSSYRGSGFSISMTDGGIRENITGLLDGTPKGVWTLLDAFPGGIPAAERVPANAIALQSIRFDPSLLMQRLGEVVDIVLPGNGARIEPLLAADLVATGIDLRKDLLDVFGDELTGVQFLSSGLMAPPDWAITASLRDEEGAKRLIQELDGLFLEQHAPIRLQPFDLPGGESAFRVMIEEFPMLPPTLVIADGRMACASQPNLALAAARGWQDGEERSTLAADAAFQRTMHGLSEGHVDDAAGLVYLNLKELAPTAFSTTVGMMPSEWVDTVAAPDAEALAAHLGGAAIAVRHDSKSFSIDTFSPVGVLIPSLVAAAASGRVRVGRELENGEGDAASVLNDRAWQIVSDPDSRDADYRGGLRMAQSAVRMDPENPFYLNTLGVAQYRNGNWREALDTLREAAERNAAESHPYPSAEDSVFMAMAQWQLGNENEARELLDRTRKEMEGIHDEELESFLAEAEALIEAQ